jgi:hypothetical protein
LIPDPSPAGIPPGPQRYSPLSGPTPAISSPYTGLTPPPSALIGTGLPIVPTAIPRESLDSPGGAQLASQTSSLGFNMFNQDKTAKRSPARLQKLLADVYAMAGRFDLAVANLTSCVDAMKGNGDVLWQASAMESLVSCELAVLAQKTEIMEVENDVL